MIRGVNVDLALAMVRDLMDANGLTDWTLVLDRAKRRAGSASVNRKQISLSRAHVELYSSDQVRTLALHEIAHALAGPGHGHDAHWRRICLAIGGDGKTRIDPSWPAPEALWQGSCPNGHQMSRHRRARGRTSCGICSPNFTGKYLITWRNVRTGEVIT